MGPSEVCRLRISRNDQEQCPQVWFFKGLGFHENTSAVRLVSDSRHHAGDNGECSPSLRKGSITDLDYDEEISHWVLEEDQYCSMDHP